MLVSQEVWLEQHREGRRRAGEVRGLGEKRKGREGRERVVRMERGEEASAVSWAQVEGAQRGLKRECGSRLTLWLCFLLFSIV